VAVEGCGSWSLDFYDFKTELDSAGDELVARFGNVHEWAARNGARQGTPILVGPSGVADARINLFFRIGSVAARRPRTWRRYAYSLLVWLDFLAGRGRSWDAVTMADFDAFKHWRMTDHRNGARVRATSFDADRAALNSFYRWAGERYGLVNPVPTVVTVLDDPVVRARTASGIPPGPRGPRGGR
jgi:Phage integrase, N-terminal SAM-like domain